ncbi:uncharacterized protein MYCFIDRAFT_210201 [Pseudocercospora fijiensis CIRAD86]|uniref:Uncharacterized protein n=1 Tax=Pseudocercospora fijiensis (strain CIRAD86) TaxID=383855 RepID=M3B7N3_PSEFD|nr:uncharacterized protein MYCFIDRAFT_210201 [Pseudocercospora fijiensis CIRAD86]EME85317.1 hypothetical protein MYCFIDRAFT_210201 [Pseudocercospora fijiensis CIRAD86]
MSEQKVEEQIASTGGGAPSDINAAPVETSVNEPTVNGNPATEAVTSSSAPATSEPAATETSKTDADLPTKKLVKDVTGREKKSTLSGILKKLMFWKKDKKKPAEAEAEAVTGGATTA